MSVILPTFEKKAPWRTHHTMKISLISSLLAPAALQATGTPPVDFVRDIQPLLAARCVACHGPQRSAGNLALHTRETALKEGDSGSRGIVPGKPEESEVFLRLVTNDHSELMPRGGPLAPEQIAKIKLWISGGAPWSSPS